MKHIISTSAQLSPAAIARCSDERARLCVSYELAKEYTLLPLSLAGNNELHVALPPHTPIETIQAIRFATGYAITISELPKEILNEAIFISYQGSELKLSESISALPNSEIVQSDVKILWANHDNQVLKAIETLIEYSIARGASDLHLCPEAHGVYARLRIKGELHTTSNFVFTRDLYGTVGRRLKVLANLSSATIEPQDGSFIVPTSIGEIPVRMSIIPTIHGEKIALRFLGNAERFDIYSLGISSEILQVLRAILNQKEGLILIAGPTGSGKTTTLYALLELLVAKPIHLMSIEDPVERVIPHISQMQVNPDRGITFAGGLRAILRQDPDVIFVGEIRDEETASLCIKAATTGHLVLSTVHSSSNELIIDRFNQLGVSRNELLTVSKAFLSQRLVPLLCDQCKVINLHQSNEHGFKVYQPVGCKVCDFSGYARRGIVCEFAEIQEAVLQYPFGTLNNAWRELFEDGKVTSL